MDELHATVLAIAGSLSRLSTRLSGLPAAPSSIPEPPLRTDSVLGLQPPSPWLDAVDPRTSLDCVRGRIELVLAQLLTLLEGPAPIDPLRVCLILHQLSHPSGRWSSMVLRFAGHFDVTLTDRPLEQPELRPLQQEQLTKPARATQ